MYVLDGNWLFSAVSFAAYWFPFHAELCPLITVGIGYPTDTFNKLMGLRARDFTPTRDPQREAQQQQAMGFDYVTGGSANFLRFIRKELFPFITAEYRVDAQYRGVYGYSLGGSFVLRSRAYDGLQLEHAIFSGETHISVVGASVGRALHSVYGER